MFAGANIVTNLCVSRAQSQACLSIAGDGYTDKDLKTFTRDIPAGYYLRPIPQGQHDGMELLHLKEAWHEWQKALSR